MASRNDTPISKDKQRYAAARNYSTKVQFQGNGLVSLGDFTVNLSNRRKLIANIAVKYTNEEKWYSMGSESDDIHVKGTVLRNEVINSLYGVTASTNSDKIKNEIKDNLNSHLSGGKIEEVYFNKFIVQ